MPNSLLNRPPSVSKIWYFSWVPCHTDATVSALFRIPDQRYISHRSIDAYLQPFYWRYASRPPKDCQDDTAHADFRRQQHRAGAAQSFVRTLNSIRGGRALTFS